MSAPSVFLFGLSHVVSLQVAQAGRVARNAASFRLDGLVLLPKYNPLYSFVDGRHQLHPEIEPELRRIVEELKPRFLLGALWGNQHFAFSTWNFPRRMDFVLPAEPDLPLDPEAEIVPYDLAYDFYRAHCEFIRLLIEAARRVADAPLYLVKAPPPVFDFGAIPGGTSSQEVDKLVAEHGVTPPHLRYKCWRLIERIQQDIADPAGVTVLPVPPETVGPDGFRRREYYSTDWIHANAAYAELVLKQCDALAAVEEGSQP